MMTTTWLARGAAAVTAALAVTASAQQPAARVWSGDAAADARAVREVYQQFLDGLRRRDVAVYRDLLTPGYVHVWGDSGEVSVGREARLAWDRAQTGRTERWEVVGCEVQSYGDAAVGPCWYRHAGTDRGARDDWTGVSLVTFVRGRDGRWRIAATRPSPARATTPVARDP